MKSAVYMHIKNIQFQRFQQNLSRNTSENVIRFIANQSTASLFSYCLLGMDQELLVFRKYLQSSQWINPIRLFIGKAYCGKL